MPDQLNINNQTYNIRNLIFNPKPFIEGGMASWVEEANKQFASKVYEYNIYCNFTGTWSNRY